MMEQLGTVVDNSQHGFVTVAVEVKSACGHCSNGESCGTQAIAKAFSKKVQHLTIASNKKFALGENLKLGLPESVVLKSAALVYLLPLLGIFSGALLAQMLLSQFIGANAHTGADFFVTDIFVALASIFSGIGFWYFGKQKAKKLEIAATPIILSTLGSEIII